jgi:signal transduction histidine kinase
LRGILNFARTEEKDIGFTEFSLTEIINNALDMLAVKHKLAGFPLEIDMGTCDLIFGVKAQIMEAVYNIIDNGHEACQEKAAKLRHEAEEKGEEGVITGYSPNIKFTHIEKDFTDVLIIEDNGIGIKETDKRKIFAPFFTTKSSYKSGSGIGAYVVKRMVEENHKGKIRFDSEYLKGTKFTIELPKKNPSVPLAK